MSEQAPTNPGDALDQPVVCVDLDGVLNLYDRWIAPEYFHPPRPGAAEFLAGLRAAGYRVVVFTVRWHEWVSDWLATHGLAQYVDQVTDRKPPAHVYLDDRAVCFRGNFEDALRAIRVFRPHWDEPDAGTPSSHA